jgi:hypothetical protein
VQDVYQYVKTQPKKAGLAIKFNLVRPEEWQQLTAKVCFTQLNVRTTCKRPDTPMELTVTKTMVGYQELFDGGMTGAELIEHRNTTDAKDAAMRADAKEYAKVKADLSATRKALEALGF